MAFSSSFRPRLTGGFFFAAYSSYYNGMRHRSGSNQIFSGLGFIALFSTLYFIFHGWFWIFPLFFAGVLPVMKGIDRVLSDNASRRIEKPRKQRPLSREERERRVLTCARSCKGIVTPALIAVETEISIDQAAEILEDLVRRGYASLEVRDNGGLEYHFSDFTD